MTERMKFIIQNIRALDYENKNDAKIEVKMDTLNYMKDYIEKLENKLQVKETKIKHLEVELGKCLSKNIDRPQLIDVKI